MTIGPVSVRAKCCAPFGSVVGTGSLLAIKLSVLQAAIQLCLLEVCSKDRLPVPSALCTMWEPLRPVSLILEQYQK